MIIFIKALIGSTIWVIDKLMWKNYRTELFHILGRTITRQGLLCFSKLVKICMNSFCKGILKMSWWFTATLEKVELEPQFAVSWSTQDWVIPLWQPLPITVTRGSPQEGEYLNLHNKGTFNTFSKHSKKQFKAPHKYIFQK